MMIDLEVIKADNDLEETIISYLGEPEKSNKWLCPFHTEKTPSFTVWAGGERFKCFGCGVEGDVLDFLMMIDNITLPQAANRLGGYILDLGLSPAEIKVKKAELKAEQERKNAERLLAKQAKENAALKRIQGMEAKAEWYHSQVGYAVNYWHSQGINDDLIEKHKFGYAPHCPVLYQDEIDQGSYVIPYYESEKLVSIRHRLSQPNGHGKYRPEFAGLPPHLYNVDSLHYTDQISFYLSGDEAIVVEGEIKAAVCGDRLGCACLGLPGIQNWRPEWSGYFRSIKTAYVIPDSGLRADIKQKAVERIANSLKCKIILCSLPCKPDDFFTVYNGTTQRFLNYLNRGRLWQ